MASRLKPVTLSRDPKRHASMHKIQMEDASAHLSNPALVVVLRVVREHLPFSHFGSRCVRNQG